MRKIIQKMLVTVGIATLLVTACTPDDKKSDVALQGGTVFQASTEQQSRTTLGEGYKVLWSEDDQIVVFGLSEASGGGYVGNLTSGAGSTLGEFTVHSQFDSSKFDSFLAFYPYSMFSEFTRDNYYQFNLPDQPIFTDSNFVTNANPMVAFGTEHEGLKFRNLLGIAEFQITGSGSIEQIDIYSGDNKPLSGEFYANPMTAELTPAAEAFYMHSYLFSSLETPIELSSTPRSIYALLPPATYEGLTIRTTDSNGVVTSRKATKPITIERSHITPISEFTHTTQTVPYVSVCLTPGNTTYLQTYVYFRRNNAATGFKYFDLYRDKYEQYIADGMTDETILDTYGHTTSSAGGSLYFNNLGKVFDVVVLARAFSDNEQQPNVSRLEFQTIAFPFTNDFSIEAYGEPTITANTASFNLRTTGLSGKRKIEHCYLLDEAYNEAATEGLLPYYTVSNGDEVVLSEDETTVTLTELLPGTQYHFCFTVSDMESILGYSSLYTRYAQLGEVTFRTTDHDPSNATVAVTASVVKDWEATLSFTVSEGASSIKYVMNTDAETTFTHDQVALYGTPVEVPTGVTQFDLTFNRLSEETKYYIYAIAYDSNDDYGVLATETFTTTPLQAVPSEGYNQFLGNYTMTAQTNGADIQRPVTITQAVEGRTYYINGLISDESKATYDFTDDTMIARYVDGSIEIFCQELPQECDLGKIATNLSNGQYIWKNYDVCLTSEYNNGIVRPRAEANGVVWTGFAFDANNIYYIDLVYNITLVKDGSTLPRVVLGNYSMLDYWNNANTFTVTKSDRDENEYLVSNFAINGTSAFPFYATFDPVALTLTLDGTVQGYESYGSFFDSITLSTGSYRIMWQTGDSGSDPCVLRVDGSSMEIVELMTEIYVPAIDSDNKVAGAWEYFLANTPISLVEAASTASRMLHSKVHKAVEGVSVKKISTPTTTLQIPEPRTELKLIDFATIIRDKNYPQTKR